MRSITLATLLLSLTLTTTVRAQSFDVGDNVLSAGIGFGGYYRSFNSYSRNTPAISLSYEKGFRELGPGVLGLGGYVGYKSLGYVSSVGLPAGYKYDYSWTYLIIGARGTWHYNDWHEVDGLDVYGGLMLSYNIVSFNNNSVFPSGVVSSYSSSGSYLGLTALLGGRYYFTDALAAQLELGYGVSAASIGLAYRF